MTTLSETDAVVQTDADAAAVPTLPWHYLAAGACLLRGKTVTTRPDPGSDPPTVQRSLHKRLIALSNEALHVACAPTQAGDAKGGLFSYIRPIGSTAGKEYYQWTSAWPVEFKIRLRDGAPDYILSPTGLVVPSPFPDETNPTLNDRIAEARAEANAGPLPGLGAVAGDPTLGTSASTGVALTPFMKAVDAAIDPCSPTTRGLFAPHRSTGAKAWLVSKAEALYPGFVCPASLTVHVDDSKTTPQTTWEIRDGHLHLEMGWLPHPKQELPCPPANAKSLTVDHWPCGAFTKM